MSKTWQWALGTFGVVIVTTVLTVCTFALKSYNHNLIAQEVQSEVAPFAEQQQKTNQALETILFQRQLDQDREAMEECEAEERTDCQEESDWRWDEYFPWTECAAQFKDPKKRIETCGPRPVYQRS